MRGLLARFRDERKATTAIEYGLIAALIAAVMIAGLGEIGDALQGQVIVIGTGLE